MQFESNLSSFGRTWPFSKALRMLSSASLADLLENANKKAIDLTNVKNSINIIMCTNENDNI